MGNLGLGSAYYVETKYKNKSMITIGHVLQELLDFDQSNSFVTRWDDVNGSEYSYVLDLDIDSELIRYVEYEMVDVDEQGDSCDGEWVSELYYKNELVYEKLEYDGESGYHLVSKNAPINANPALKAELFAELDRYLTKWEEEIRIEALDDTQEDW